MNKYTYKDPLIEIYKNNKRGAVECSGYESSCKDGDMYVLLPYDKNGNWNEDKICFGNKDESILFCKEIGLKFVEDK